jgi:hypothetical protein
MKKEIYFSGAIRIKKQSTIDSWKSKGWWGNLINQGYIYAEGCGRFRKEDCICCKCRKNSIKN